MERSRLSPCDGNVDEVHPASGRQERPGVSEHPWRGADAARSREQKEKVVVDAVWGSDGGRWGSRAVTCTCVTCGAAAPRVASGRARRATNAESLPSATVAVRVRQRSASPSRLPTTPGGSMQRHQDPRSRDSPFTVATGAAAPCTHVKATLSTTTSATFSRRLRREAKRPNIRIYPIAGERRTRSTVCGRCVLRASHNCDIGFPAGRVGAGGAAVLSSLVRISGPYVENYSVA